MRTTLTLDKDIAIQLKNLQQKKKAKFKDLVNETLRLGLQQMAAPGPTRKKFQTRTTSLGKCLLESIDNVAETLDVTEGESFQ